MCDVKNDKKPQYVGLGAAEPLHIHLTSAIISRSADGVFDIQGKHAIYFYLLFITSISERCDQYVDC